MALWPRMFDPNYIPYCDPVIVMTFGDDKNKLVTSDGGGQFELTGNIRVVALEVLRYALGFNTELKIIGMSFSVFEFKFQDGVEILPRWQSNMPGQALLLIEEMKKIMKMGVFF
jgi:hypothetical protein